MGLAYTLGLGNDEVYYAQFTARPDWSHFDHPGMMGWLGWLLGGWALPTQPFFVRLLPLLAGSINMLLMHRVGVLLSGSERVGVWSAVLFGTNVYAGVICGVFLMPDAAQSMFWLAALAVWLSGLKQGWRSPWHQTQHAVSLGLLLAAAMASKYHSAFLVAAILGHAVSPNAPRGAWRTAWLAALVASIGGVPTLLWNVREGWPTFRFHSARVMPESGLHPEWLLQEILGEFAYQSPPVFILIVLGLVAAVRGKLGRLGRVERSAVLWAALPLWLTFLAVALFRKTLPHWTGPAFLSLIPFGAMWLDRQHRSLPRGLVVAVGAHALVVLAALLHIRLGWGAPSQQQGLASAHADHTLDVYGWDQTTAAWQAFLTATHVDPHRTLLLSPGWFPTGHVAFSMGRPTGTAVAAIGSLNDVHQFAWWHVADSLDERIFDQVFFVSDARNRREPPQGCDWDVAGADPVLIIPIHRGGKVVNEIRIFRVTNWDGQRDLTTP